MDGGDREAYSPPFSITINLLETSGKLELGFIHVVPTAPAQSLAHVVQPTMSSCYDYYCLVLGKAASLEKLIISSLAHQPETFVRNNYVRQ